jgi:hypothetical protein
MVPAVGLEPTLLSKGDFESPVYTNFTTLAFLIYNSRYKVIDETIRFVASALHLARRIITTVCMHASDLSIYTP